jgi:NADPH:quinone reductase-like Zn-dependent oxidoreductase
MKALVTTAYGDVDKLTVADVPEPQIGHGDVKVKVHAASINPMDWRLLAGQARTIMELHFPSDPRTRRFGRRARGRQGCEEIPSW